MSKKKARSTEEKPVLVIRDDELVVDDISIVGKIDDIELNGGNKKKNKIKTNQLKGPRTVSISGPYLDLVEKCDELLAAELVVEALEVFVIKQDYDPRRIVLAIEADVATGRFPHDGSKLLPLLIKPRFYDIWLASSEFRRTTGPSTPAWINHLRNMFIEKNNQLEAESKSQTSEPRRRGPKKKYDADLDRRIHKARKAGSTYEQIAKDFSTSDLPVDVRYAQLANQRQRKWIQRHCEG